MFSLYFLILFLLIIPIEKSINIPETILFKNENITIHDLIKPKYYFKLSIDSEMNIPNYIQILVTQDESGSFLNKYIISYYNNDATFSQLEQISNDLPSSSLWLNKEQIKGGFYFSVENKYQDCKYQINIIPKNFIELTFESNTYSHYITNENKNISFLIKSENNFNPEINDTIILWAYGNKKIKVDLNLNLSISNYQKHNKYNVFIIKQKKYQEYIVVINGEIGDYIDIGFICLNKYNICKNCKREDKGLYYGFLKKDYLTEICFKPNLLVNLNYPYIKILDDINININSLEGNINNRKCIKLPKDLDKLFFSFHYLPESSPNSEFNFDEFYLQTGINYHQIIYENKTVQYLPLRLENNYEYIICYIKFGSIPIKTIAYISINNYEKFIPLKQNFDSYFFTLNKNDLKDNKKAILYFYCQKGDHFGKCDINIIIYTDKTNNVQKYLNESFTLIKNNDIKKFSVYKTFNNYLYTFEKFDKLYIEILSGNVSFILNNKYLNYYNYANNYLYEFGKKEEMINIDIISYKNSIYSIQVLYAFDFNQALTYHFNVGSNYLLYLEKGKIYNLYFQIKQRTFTQIDDHEKNLGKYYIYNNFYPINCTIDIKEEEFLKEIKSPNSDYEIFYQNIKSTTYHNIAFIINIKNILKNDSCLVYISSYNINSSSYYSDDSIILKENQPQFFAFNKKINTLNFSYYFAEIHDDILIKINLFNKTNFNMGLYINNFSKIIEYEFNSDKIIEIKSKYLIDSCIYENQICKIFFNISLNNKFQYLEENSVIKIVIRNSNVIKENKLNFDLFIFSLIIFASLANSFNKFVIKKIKENKTEEEGIELIDIM